ncbi:uncharacterized protein BJX67DRAFT_267407 [Aspergillus lucknowensis]|uniref:Uncharacterized protein n=1 Tax=Aspergillus lucknowensis TaxID=176173 RepID=A0ABR4LF07_9EURO
MPKRLQSKWRADGPVSESRQRSVMETLKTRGKGNPGMLGAAQERFGTILALHPSLSRQPDAGESSNRASPGGFRWTKRMFRYHCKLHVGIHPDQIEILLANTHFFQSLPNPVPHPLTTVS